MPEDVQLTEVRRRLRALWEQCEMATSNKPELREFVLQMVQFVEECRNIHGSEDGHVIIFHVGRDAEERFDVGGLRAKSLLRTIIINVASHARRHGGHNFNPYGDSVAFS